MIAAAPQIKYLHLKIVARRYPRFEKSEQPIGDENKFLEIYAPLSPIDQEPFVLGTGGFASVFLAFDAPNTSGQPLAVKLLRKERGTGVQNGRQRFIEEIFYNQVLSRVPGISFVEYLGFGYLANMGAHPGVNVSDKEKQWVLAGISESDLKTATSVNLVTSVSSKFLSEHQNLFFVMGAAWFSLDRLLVSNQPLHESNSLNLSYREQIAPREGHGNREKGAAQEEWHRENTNFGDAHEQLKRAVPINREVAATAKRLGISESSSGLEILSKIRCDAALGSPVATRMLLQVFAQLVSAVSAIHRAREHTADGERTVMNLAHRDLKPANFLISQCQENIPAVLLSDLGFIAAEQNGRTMQGAFGRVGEPGVLPQGTVMFQAPEQMLSGREVSFELVNASSYLERQRVLLDSGKQPTFVKEAVDKTSLVEGKFFPDAIRIRTVGGIEIEPDDRILCNDIQLEDGGDGNRMLVRYVVKDPMVPTSVVAFIVQAIVPNQTTRTEYTGTLLKPVGQHSDVFSLGCHAYFLASGGKDPSEFYRTYLRPASGLIYLHPAAPKTDCLAIARFLAERNGASGEVGEVRALATVLEGRSGIAALYAVISNAKKFRVSSTRDHFLFSTDGRPIGIILLFIIVSLMCRGAEGSYVSGGPKTNKESSAWRTKPMTEMEQFLNQVVQQLQFRYPGVMADDPFQGAWVHGLNVLVKLRLLASSLEQEGEAARAEPQADQVKSPAEVT